MSKSIIAEGKTTEEAIEHGLKVLKVSRKQVNIEVMQEEKHKSFFDILAPRVVKVELTVKENYKDEKPVSHQRGGAVRKEEAHEAHREKRTIKYNQNEEELNAAKQQAEGFMQEFIAKLALQDVSVEVNIVEYAIHINVTGDNVGFLIGYRGESLDALQNLISSIVNNKDAEKIKVLLDISGYRQKRVKTLEELAEKIARTVVRTGKPVTLEPMSAYDRKIIHSKIQDHPKVTTYSSGEEPFRKIVVTLK